MTSTGLHASAQGRRTRLKDRLRASRLRQRIKSSRGYWRIKLLLKRLSGRELWLRRDTKIATRELDDWQYAAEALPAGAVIYCFGVGESIGFETALLEQHDVSVHAFDPTPAAMSWIEGQAIPAGLNFHPWAVAGRDTRLTLYPRLRRRGRKSKTMWTSDPAQADPASSIEVPALTLRSIMRELGHDRVDLVKLDVEGAEYAAIDAMLEASVLPTQLLVEFHHRFPGLGKAKTRDCITDLASAGYEIFAISRTGRELSFIKTGDEPAPRAPASD